MKGFYISYIILFGWLVCKMSNEKHVKKVVFNNDVFEPYIEKDTDVNEKIIHVVYPKLRTWAIFSIMLGVFFIGGTAGYNLGSEFSSRIVFYLLLSCMFITLLGIIMLHYSSDEYYKKDGDDD